MHATTDRSCSSRLYQRQTRVYAAEHSKTKDEPSGRRRRISKEEEKKSQAGGIMAAVLGLLAFMLAFSFGMAASRFGNRKQLVVEEANAIGTAYLRTQLLSEPHSIISRDLLRKYVDVHIEGVKLDDPQQVERALVRSDELHDRLWSQAVDLAKKHPDSIVVGLYTGSDQTRRERRPNRCGHRDVNRIAATVADHSAPILSAKLVEYRTPKQMTLLAFRRSQSRTARSII